MRLRSPNQVRLFFVSALCILSCSQTSVAEPWIEAGDERTRHHLQVMADAGVINLPLTSWPLMWAGVRRELNTVDATALNEMEARSYQHLKRALRRARQKVSYGQLVNVNSSTPGFTDYATDSRERLESRTHVTYAGGRWNAKLQASVVGDPIDDRTFRLDGSYATRQWGNWAVGVGAVDRWWGPGWQSSLILSHNARPSPGVFVNRVEHQPFDLPVLNWLGPWDLRVFLNQLESDRGTPHAKLFAMRANFRPLPSLEVGLSRAAQWGGDGRPEDLATFWNMLSGKDNRGSGGIEADASNEPGNQLAGVDWRVSHTVKGVPSAFYGQLIGEDEAGGMPSRFLGLAGLETSFLWRSTHHRLALEASNTTAQFTKDGRPNYAYEHSLYPSGYRTHGRPIGASTDNDSELVVLKGFHHFTGERQFSWTVGSARMNVDDTNKNAPGGNALTDGAVDLWYASAKYTLPLTRTSELSMGGQYYEKPLAIRDEAIDSSVYVSYTLRLSEQ